MRERSSPWLLSTALATALACFVLLTLLGHKPLTEWDEGIYAEVSREMLSRGWLIPHWNGQLWMEKPPLMFWITATFFRLFGVTEFWARAASAFSGIAIIAILHHWLLRRKGLVAAWFGTVLLLANFGFLHSCHTGELDILLSLGCVLALCGLTQVEEEAQSGWLLFWVGTAIAALTKGAAAVTLPATLLVLALLGRWNARRFSQQFWIGLCACCALLVPWPWFMARHFGSAFWNEFLGKHVLTRATSQMEGHHTHWWFYLFVILVSAAPFVVLYPAAWLAAVKDPTLRAWAVFALVTLILFSLAGTRLPHYIVPAYPAFTVITSVWLAGRFTTLQQTRPSIKRWAAYATATAFFCVVAILLTAPGRRSLHSARLSDGTVLPDSRDSASLLRQLPAPLPGESPLLYWREGPISSIATSVFYSRRTVQQVQLQPLPATVPRDRYRLNPKTLDQAVTAQPSFIILDRILAPSIPASLIYQPLRTGSTMELGTIERR